MNATQRARLRGVIIAYNADMKPGLWLSICALAEALGADAVFDKKELHILATYLLEDV